MAKYPHLIPSDKYNLPARSKPNFVGKVTGIKPNTFTMMPKFSDDEKLRLWRYLKKKTDSKTAKEIFNRVTR